jgi:hypothetical protein
MSLSANRIPLRRDMRQWRHLGFAREQSIEPEQIAAQSDAAASTIFTDG